MRAIGADQVVSTTIVPTSGDAVRIDYVMRQEGAAWKIVDVLLDGTISRVAVQRSDFRGVLARGGAPALIASLAAARWWTWRAARWNPDGAACMIAARATART